MRRAILFVLATLILAAIAAGAGAQFTVPNYIEQGGARSVIGGALDVLSGGEIDIESGGALKIAGTDKTAVLAATVANPVAGVASGYKVARGETALDGSNPTDAATGLTTIVACTATVKTSSAPGVSTSMVTYATSGATLSLYGWKVTATGDATLIASDGTDTVGWICVGT